MSNNSIQQNKQIPMNYSGVTINISNPAVNTGVGKCTCPCCNNYSSEYFVNNQNQLYQYPQASVYVQEEQNNVVPSAVNSSENKKEYAQNGQPQSVYPAPYYINNYNSPPVQNQRPVAENNFGNIDNPNKLTKEESAIASQNIINDINTRVEAENKAQQNGTQKKVVKLTNEYIMSLENYLNNPNKDIRVMATKELLERFAEDTDRFDDEALNALLNKMLQDPEKIIRIGAMSALSSGLASGNDYTVKLLTDIQQNPESDKEDVIDSANILLKMSSSTEYKFVPQKNAEKENVGEENADAN